MKGFCEVNRVLSAITYNVLMAKFHTTSNSFHTPFFIQTDSSPVKNIVTIYELAGHSCLMPAFAFAVHQQQIQNITPFNGIPFRIARHNPDAKDKSGHPLLLDASIVVLKNRDEESNRHLFDFHPHLVRPLLDELETQQNGNISSLLERGFLNIHNALPEEKWDEDYSSPIINTDDTAIITALYAATGRHDPEMEYLFSLCGDDRPWAESMAMDMAAYAGRTRTFGELLSLGLSPLNQRPDGTCLGDDIAAGVCGFDIASTAVFQMPNATRPLPSGEPFDIAVCRNLKAETAREAKALAEIQEFVLTGRKRGKTGRGRRDTI